MCVCVCVFRLESLDVANLRGSKWISGEAVWSSQRSMHWHFGRNDVPGFNLVGLVCVGRSVTITCKIPLVADFVHTQMHWSLV